MTDIRSDLAHLFRRAGFGARPADLDVYERVGYVKAVDDLLVAPATNGQPAAFGSTTAVSKPAAAVRAAQAGWVKTMVVSKTPLVERMVLLLADHFATAYSPTDNVDIKQLRDQQAVFRRNALGNFRSMCHELLADVALGCFLDHDTNRAEAPNENLARELLELFILGPGHFSEADVRELARAFTGYELRGSGDSRKLVWVAALHDSGTKTILGRSGRFTPPDALDVVLDHPQATRHIAHRLLTTFLHPDPSAVLVDRIAGVLRREDWELAPALRAIFTSAEFLAPDARHALVRSPAEFVAAAMRALKRTEYAEGAAWAQNAGQSLFRPPNVGGWTPNEGWLAAGSVLARYNAASRLAGLHLAAPAGGLPATPDGRAWAAALGMTELAPATQQAIDTYLHRMDGRGAIRAGGVITILLSSPDFSLA